MLAKIVQFVNHRVWRSWTKVKMKARAFIDQHLKVKMKARAFIDQHLGDIILVVGVILISLLSFAMGYIVAKEQEKEPIEVNETYESSYYWSGDQRIISGLEIV